MFVRPTLLLVLAACAAPEGRPAGIALVDDAGDTVRLAAPAARVVSLVPATTELLFALGAGSTVVGRTRWCDYPAAAAAVPDLGDGLTPSLEAILERSPDLVVLYHSSANALVAARLRALGIPVARFATDRLADVKRVGRHLGALTGRPAAAESLAQAFDRDLARATVPPPARPVKVLLLAWDQPPIAIGGGSFQSEVVERAGGRNLFADLSAPSAPVSLEAITARDPDVILTSAEDEPGVARRAEWQVVEAVRERRFVRLTGSAFSRPGPRAPEAVAELAARLRAWGP